MLGSGLGWWFIAVAVLAAAIPFFIVRRQRWWPSAWGWAFCFFFAGLMVADGFRDWTPVALFGILIGLTLGFAGVLNGPNSPVA